jgi:hypothetical protein
VARDAAGGVGGYEEVGGGQAMIRLGLVLLMLLSGCIHYTPPAPRSTFSTTIDSEDYDGAFRALVAIVNRAGLPIQASDSGAGLLRVGPVDLRDAADCGNVRADIDNIRVSAPIGTITFVLEKRSGQQQLTASSQIVQTLYQMNRGLYWQPTNVMPCSSTHSVEGMIADGVRTLLGLKAFPTEGK